LGEVFLTTISDGIRTCKDHRNHVVRPLPLEQDALSNELVNERPAGLRLTRLTKALYESRPELQRYFPDPTGRDSVRFLVWLLTYGRHEQNLSDRNLAPLRAQWRSLVDSLPGPLSRLRYEVILKGMAASIYMRSALARLVLLRARFWFARNRTDAVGGRDHGISATHEFGVNLAGYFHSETGVGQSARAAHAALKAASVPVSLRCVSDLGPSRKQDNTTGSMSAEFPYSVNLFHVNADQTAEVRREFGEHVYHNRYNIGYWAWELEEFPDRWTGAFSQYREIWTPSNFCRKAISGKASVPVFCVPHAIAPVLPIGIDRQHFGLRPDAFIFFFAFDVLSVMERKNPLAVIRAFEMAFGPDSHCQLLLKINNAESKPQCIETLKNACSSSAIRILDSALTREEMYALTHCSDCIVSLHRSEGFGLFMAEAMYFGKPVIATNYSGNTDFTLPDNSLLVDYKLIPVGRHCDPYDPDSLWADPDVEHAARHMANIAASAELRAQFSSAGRAFVRTVLSPGAVGQTMRQRLDTLWVQGPTPAARVALTHDLRTGTVQDEPSRAVGV
jgi:glycosyltransferase involved in cell wall biosynthesis